MALFSFGKKKARSIALIDIGSSSVGGAYVHVVEGQKPVLYYTARVDIEVRTNEDARDSMMRSLTFLERLLIEEGAPALRRETGSAELDTILVSISAPWQESTVTKTVFDEGKPFTFTRKHVEEAEHRLPKLLEDRVRSDQRVLASILNGYETTRPYGKRVSRAELHMLSSTLDKETAKRVETSLRRAFHTHALQIVAFAPIAYDVFRMLYPHQEDFMVLDVSGTGTDLLMVKNGLLSDVVAIPQGTQEVCASARKAGTLLGEQSSALCTTETDVACVAIQEAWIQSLHEALFAFSEKEVLPRTVFLLADDEVRVYLKRLLENSTLKSLWLTDDPLSIIALTPAHLAAKVATRGQGTGDLYMALLALYSAHTSTT